jgi:hypothetical protein
VGSNRRNDRGADRQLRDAPEAYGSEAGRPGGLHVPTAEDGRECSMVFGTNWIDDPNVLFYGDLRTTPIKVKGGKK